MNEDTYNEMNQLHESGGAVATVDQLIQTLRDDKNYDRLFDALLLKKRLEMGVPVVRPTSFDNLPEDRRAEFEEHYVNAAREIGALHLEEGSIPRAWIYLRTIREPEPIVAAINALEISQDVDEEIVDIALYQGVAPAKGLEMLLASHGTCNSITVLDQQFMQLEPQVRQECAALLAQTIYRDLTATIKYEVERKQGSAPTEETLRELITGQEWLFAEDNYHIDVSHLHAVIRFCRSLDADRDEVRLATELTEYGAQLSPQYRYAGDPPFEDYYTSASPLFNALTDTDRDAALDFFRDQLAGDAPDSDKQLTAYHLVDLLRRIDRTEDALDIAAKYLLSVEDQLEFSFAELCAETGRYDKLMEVSRAQHDPVGYAAALVEQARTP